MKRTEFLKTLAFLPISSSIVKLQELNKIMKPLEATKLMPVLFVGHGSPMNAIEENEFTKKWVEIAKNLPKPTAILCISAHWETKGTFITAMPMPDTIHDFGGFPQKLFDAKYPAKGNKTLATETQQLVKTAKVELTTGWGLDHGCWSVLAKMYPKADIPVIQMSMDHYKEADFHYNLGKELAALRKKGVLILGSGNMVHNLGRMQNTKEGLDWAIEMNTIFKKKITDKDHQALINYKTLNKSYQLAIPTPEHYLPLMYVLGLQDKKDKVTIFNDKIIAGSLSMTSVLIENS